MARKKMSRKKVLKIIEEAARDGREKLDLNGKGITELPDEIGQLTNLETLWLNDNPLTSLQNAL